MVVVKLMGGLGNQMFQYALGKSLSARLQTDFKLDLEYLLDRTPRENFVFRDYDLDIFCLEAERASKEEVKQFIKLPAKGIIGNILRKIKNKLSASLYFYEPHFHFAAEVFNLPKNCYVEGYWQSPKYFMDIEEQIRNDFKFKDDLQPASKALSIDILSKNSVCINVRRADFVNNSFHGLCDMRYFEPSIEIMKYKIENPHFFIFSDDPQWCRENFKSDFQSTVVGHEYKGRKFSDYLQLMSMCRHFIIPNSSFAWWATWLNRDKDKIVIAPTNWFADQNWDAKDLIPGNWIRVAN